MSRDHAAALRERIDAMESSMRIDDVAADADDLRAALDELDRLRSGEAIVRVAAQALVDALRLYQPDAARAERGALHALEAALKAVGAMSDVCWRCNLPLDEERICSGSGYSLPCAGAGELWRARAEKAEAEVKRLVRCHDDAVRAELQDYARAEAAEKRAAALEGYARHRDFCDASTDPAFPCCKACGLSALLSPTVP